MKRIVYSLLIALIAITGCKKSETDLGGDNGKIPILIGLDIVGNSGASNSGSKVNEFQDGGSGKIMTEMKHFGSTKLALYGVLDFYGTQTWTEQDRIIDTETAYVDQNNSKIVYGTEDKFFPEAGGLSLYSIYPQGTSDSPVVINDNGVDAPSATITIADQFKDQYDILHASVTSESVIEAQSLKLQYNHVMAQLAISIMRNSDAPEVSGGVTKITIEGYNKAEMPSIVDHKNIVVDKTSPQIVYKAFDNPAGVQIHFTATNITANTPLLLIPGKGVITKMTMTIDGQEYYADIDPEWEMKQGQINLLNVRFNKLNVQQNLEYSVSPWDDGTDHSGDLENNGREIKLSARIQTKDKSVPSQEPDWMDIVLENSRIIKGVKIDKYESGVFTTETFNTQVIHDELITVTSVKLYTGLNYATATPMFDAKLYNDGKTATGKEIVIDHLDNSVVKLRSSANQDPADMTEYAFNIDFNGMGSGTEEDPFEVATVSNLDKVRYFKGSKTASKVLGTTETGAYFMQVADITVGNFTPIEMMSGGYDGNGYAIKGLEITSNANDIGLFSIIYKSTAGPTTIQNVYIDQTSTITRHRNNVGSSTGSVVGHNSGGIVQNCVNYATVDGSNAGRIIGGIAGKIDAGGQIINCANYGEVTGFSEVGGVLGQLYQSGEVTDSYNFARIYDQSPASELKSVGGIIGKLTLASASILTNCYNTGVVQSNNGQDYVGAIIGDVTVIGSTPSFTIRNNYYLNITNTPIGRDQTAGAIIIPTMISRSETQFKAPEMIDALNDIREESVAPWQIDNPTTPINTGYPVLKWMQSHPQYM